MLERDLLTDKAARELISRIFQGFYRVGDRLPSERELASALNVSRGTIRSCIAKLRHMGLLQSKPGSGNYVCSPPRGAIPAVHASGDVFQTTLKDVLTAREAIEIPAFRLAMSNRSDQDLEELQRIIDGMKDQANDLEHFLSFDMDFHRRILIAGGNDALLVAFDAIRDFHRFSQVYTSFGDHEIEATIRHHERILLALRSGARGKTDPVRSLQNHFRDMHRYSRESD